MDEETFRLLSIIVRLLVPIITFLGLYIAARLSLEAYFKQKWWDRKVEAYITMMKHIRKVSELHREQRSVYIYKENPTRYKEIANQMKRVGDDMRHDMIEKQMFLSKRAQDIVTYDIDAVASGRSTNIWHSKDDPNLWEIICSFDDELSDNHKKLIQEMEDDLRVTKPTPFWKPPYSRGSQN